MPPSIYPAIFERDTAGTEAEWLSRLPGACRTHPLKLGPGQATVAIGAGVLRLSWQPLPERRIALLRFARLAVRYEFDGCGRGRARTVHEVLRSLHAARRWLRGAAFDATATMAAIDSGGAPYLTYMTRMPASRPAGPSSTRIVASRGTKPAGMVSVPEAIS